MECFRRNITDGICRDLPHVCQNKTRIDCLGEPRLWNDCPYLCGECHNKDCEGYSCENGGSLNLFCGCNCPDGFIGERCEIELCQSDPCMTKCQNKGKPL